MTMIIDEQSKTPKSVIFDDIYFSCEDGVGESLYNFFKGNDLPTAWQERDSFMICELGLGTGLNIVLAIDLFLKSKGKCKKLNLISIEKHPLSAEQIKACLQPWQERFDKALSLFIDHYPLNIPATHSFDITNDISVTFIFDDVKNALSSLECGVDCWFLDGFNPSKNPEMWHDAIFERMARLSNKSARFATFTAAGFVRRGLEQHGFNVEKEKGFGRKRERLKGVYAGNAKATPYSVRKAKKIAVIGAGLAGASIAYHAQVRGIEVDVFEKEDHIGAKASGNIMGLLNPALTPTQQWKNRFYAAALSYARKLFSSLQEGHDIDYDTCGSVHILSDEKKKKRFEKIVRNCGWPENYIRLISAEEASEYAGVSVPYESVYMSVAAKISPIKLVKAMLSDITCHTHVEITHWEKNDKGYRLFTSEGETYEGYDYLVLASGLSARNIVGLDIPILKPIRGQVTYLKSPEIAAALKTNLCFGSYLTKLDEQTLVTGATYDRGNTNANHCCEDDQSNLDFLAQYFPELADKMEITGGRAGVRITTEDYMPHYGFSKTDETLYYSLAHRSHGVLSSQICAYQFIKRFITSS